MATIVKTGGKWRAQVRRRGISKSATFARKSEAQAWAAQIEGSLSLNTGTIAPPRSMTLTMILMEYMRQVSVGRTAQANLERIARMIGHVPARDLSALHMQSFIKDRLSHGASGATIAGDLSALSSALKWARRVKNIDIAERLAAEARTSLTAQRISTRSAERSRIPSEDELARIYAHLEGNPRQTIPVADIARFAAVSAMRLSEIVGLRVEDVRWNEGAALIRERKHPTRKSRNDQTIPIVAEGIEMMRKAAQGRAQGLLWPHNAQSVSAAWRRACDAVGVEDLHFHDLRHLALTKLAAMGLSAPLLRTVSGHHDLKSLSRYLNLSPADFHAAYEKAKKGD